MRCLRRSMLLGFLLSLSFLQVDAVHAASVQVLTVPPPALSEERLNDLLDADLIAPVQELAKYELDGTSFDLERGEDAFGFAPQIIEEGEIKAASFTYSGASDLFYFAIKAGSHTRVFAFFDDAGQQTSFPYAPVFFSTGGKGLSNISFYGAARPVPEPTSIALFLIGALAVARLVRQRV